MKNIYLLIGTNQGDRSKTIQRAFIEIENKIGNIIGQSSIYESEAWGFQSQFSFFNVVIEIDTKLSAFELLESCQTIEKKLGRENKTRIGYEDRKIDIDILYYGATIINSQRLIIPHPKMHLRKFTLVPLCEIASQFIHPVLLHNNAKLLAYMDDDVTIKKIIF